jgi:hypothetical protein
MRFTSAESKFGVVMSAAVLVAMGGVVLAAAGNLPAASVVAVAGWVGIVAFCARCFRGLGESSAPRPWWRMTSSAFASGLMSAFFAIQSAWVLTGPGEAVPFVVRLGVAAVLLAVAIAYLHSAVRIRRSEREAREPRVDAGAEGSAL